MKIPTILASIIGVLLCACSTTQPGNTVKPVSPPPIAAIGGAGIAITTGAGPYSGPAPTYQTVPPAFSPNTALAAGTAVSRLPAGYIRVVRPSGVYYSYKGVYYKKSGRGYVTTPVPE